MCVCVCIFFTSIVRANRLTNEKAAACSGENRHKCVCVCARARACLVGKFTVGKPRSGTNNFCACRLLFRRAECLLGKKETRTQSPRLGARDAVMQGEGSPLSSKIRAIFMLVYNVSVYGRRNLNL